MATGQAGISLKERWLLFLMILLLTATGVWQLWVMRQEPDDVSPPVQADRQVLAEGIVFPVRYAQIIMPVDGIIGEVLVTEGAKVKKGQPLIRLIRQEATDEKLKDKTDKIELQAAMAGIVAYLDVKAGERVAQTAVLAQIADPSEWEVRSDDLTELSIAKIGVGDRANLTFDAIPGLEIPARVKFIRPDDEKKHDDSTYTVTIAPDRWDDRLRWNMTARISITPAQ
ncbi:efflux RND transporter periplasmic adaptor subunit [Acetonema longum]|uniref:Multidrug resistance efflux pump-like protein n=1 Tax=Acetonema longum DSM 6540 TaxID=1009370 RepID=F7NP30_9FIRM|nr:HlyD family efflux transporter periplasmic adaptor subunit [Acetonema longum]EGO62153.1 multidrug resistance efflux pump-like protein [Acetonema longum DSM 6540]